MDAELEFAIQSSTTGKQLFDQVVKTLGLREIWYFGLRYTDGKGYTTWLKLNRKVTNQDVPNTKEGGPLQFQFRAKFFPEDASEELIQEITQRMFFLQVREAVLSEEIFCPPETAVLLASYACQAKFDDFNPTLLTDDTLARERLLPKKILDQHNLRHEEWVERVANWYKDHQGMMKEDAMLEYLKIAQDLEMYGVNYFEIKNKKGTELYLGVDALGLNIYEKTDKLTPKIGFPWSEIRNISFSEKKFIIKSVDKKAPDFIFFAPRIRVNKRILALCMGNHELYMRRRKEESIEMQQMRAQAKEERLHKQAERERWRKEREAREVAERRLSEMQERLRAQNSDNERTQRAMQEYEEKIRSLERKLEEENRTRRELEEMKARLEKNNQALEEAKNSADEEYHRLLAESDEIRAQISAKNAQIENTSSELTAYQTEMERLRLDRLALEEKAKRLEQQMALSLVDEVDKEEKSFGKDLEVNAGQKNRDEEERATAIEKNQSLQAKLKSLSDELKNQRDATKLEHTDRLHEENQLAGRDKFKTLKQIRQGNTKKRVDEFESM